MVKFLEIKDITHKDFRRAIKIYKNSFPSNEKQSVFKIKKRIKENYYHLFIGYLEDKVVFMALLYPLKNTDFILLDYMATDKDFRNKKIAGIFIKHILNKIPEKYFLLEVEDPRYGTNKEEREKRLNFYKKLGAKEMKDVRYILPPLSGSTPTQMILMVLPEYDEEKISGGLVKKLIIQIYKELYNRSVNDEFLNSFINSIKNPVELV